MSVLADITEDQLSDIEDFVGDHDIEMVTDYSGRGMYGDECVGFKGDDSTNLGAIIAIALAEVIGADDAVRLIGSMRTDSMGLGAIAYFPRWQAKA